MDLGTPILCIEFNRKLCSRNGTVATFSVSNETFFIIHWNIFCNFFCRRRQKVDDGRSIDFRSKCGDKKIVSHWFWKLFKLKEEPIKIVFCLPSPQFSPPTQNGQSLFPPFISSRKQIMVTLTKPSALDTWAQPKWTGNKAFVFLIMSLTTSYLKDNAILVKQEIRHKTI